MYRDTDLEGSLLLDQFNTIIVVGLLLGSMNYWSYVRGCSSSTSYEFCLMEQVFSPAIKHLIVP